MRAVVVYESMYGNTHMIADSIASGLCAHTETVVVPVHEADAALAEDSDLLVVGGPTHDHGMSNATTRRDAVTDAERSFGLGLDPDAVGSGLREWFSSVGPLTMSAAAFDTRFDSARVLTGRASKGIERELRHHGATLISDPQSFFVTNDDNLEPGAVAQARAWGAHLGFLLDGIRLRRLAQR